MTPKDPLGNLGNSLAAESAAVEQRFDTADRLAGAPPPPETAVRATFSFPPSDHALLLALQARCLAASFQVTKSELVRAGLHALDALPPDAVREAIGTLKKYRPARGARWTAADTPSPQR
ncbi:MAG: hypothetical protein OXO56_09235 [Gammaproteobacteria bacterium]|nr:hypothetical protein [Gammaproteobacteria bacterium]